MRKNRTRPRWRGILRRVLALFMAFVTLWLLWLTADFSAAGEALRGLADNAGLAAALLDAELGGDGEDGLPELDRLALRESSMLAANLDSVTRWLAGQEQHSQPEWSDPPQPTGRPAPEPTASPDPEVRTTTAPDSIVPRTMVPGSSSRYVGADGIYIYNYTDYELDIPALLEDSLKLGLAEAEGPQVLIYHTHTTEAYTMDGADIYTESDTSRTTDPKFNMIRIGEEMKAVFEQAGLEVIHDETLYDYPVYSDAYSRSDKGIAAILEQNPSIRLVLDVHRDALVGTDGTIYKTAAGTVENCAQVMMVVGSDAGGMKHDNWRQNLSLAVGVQRAMLDRHGTLIRPIVLRSSRFNQHYRPGSLLVEVGSHGNTLQEAITAARLFAQTLAETVK